MCCLFVDYFRLPAAMFADKSSRSSSKDELLVAKMPRVTRRVIFPRRRRRPKERKEEKEKKRRKKRKEKDENRALENEKEDTDNRCRGMESGGRQVTMYRSPM